MNRCKIKSNIFCCIFSVILLISASAANGENETQKVYLGGMPFGIRFHAGEVSVIRKSSFVSSGTTVSPADEAGIMENDIISRIDSSEIGSIEDFIEVIKTKEGLPIRVTIKRGDKNFETEITPKKSDETGEYMLGILLKDSSAGIGTVTFINDDTHKFAGLGHGICDPSTGEIVKIIEGDICNVKINGITKGLCGSPGELRGSLDTEKCGMLLSNTEVGVFGVFTDNRRHATKQIEVAKQNEVKTGEATLLCTLDDNLCHEYDIEIAQINNLESSKTKNFVIKVADEKLIEKTGGIVQGMSGSPIVQNGKLIGAVTHVFVNDPCRGYGIFIDNMLDAAA